MYLALWQVAVETSSRSMADNSLVIGACVTIVGLLGLWFANVILGTRDTVREIHALLNNKRNGLVMTSDDHEVRLTVLERWRESFARDE